MINFKALFPSEGKGHDDDDDDDDDKFWFGAKIIHSSSVLRGATKR